MLTENGLCWSGFHCCMMMLTVQCSEANWDSNSNFPIHLVGTSYFSADIISTICEQLTQRVESDPKYWPTHCYSTLYTILWSGWIQIRHRKTTKWWDSVDWIDSESWLQQLMIWDFGRESQWAINWIESSIWGSRVEQNLAEKMSQLDF